MDWLRAAMCRRGGSLDWGVLNVPWIAEADSSGAELQRALPLLGQRQPMCEVGVMREGCQTRERHRLEEDPPPLALACGGRGG
ncbi:hypothetical protein NDU88_001272 [Pleurodeles waltl]|uniref:Uncharacterized protein n=1 Tax=Pleurodeles waltl TaxID=8319 RepID=A0AAV7S8H5_PLEWA|nr:hypothetical protein NDU88_001272 [Pleurodeles waltl]